MFREIRNSILKCAESGFSSLIWIRILTIASAQIWKRNRNHSCSSVLKTGTYRYISCTIISSIWKYIGYTGSVKIGYKWSKSFERFWFGISKFWAGSGSKLNWMILYPEKMTRGSLTVTHIRIFYSDRKCPFCYQIDCSSTSTYYTIGHS